MDFSRLPDKAFLRIYQYLPLEERIRIGRVNKLFRRISQLVTSRTKSLHSRNVRFWNLNEDQFAVILDLCSPNLEQIHFRHYYYTEDNTMGIRLATKFANYHCPQLTDIDLGDAPIGNSVFDQLIRNAPNIESFECRGTDNFPVFPDIMYNSLKKLRFGDANDVTLQSLTGRCPNLKQLHMGMMNNTTTNVLDEFLASVPQVNQLDLDQVTFTKRPIVVKDFVNLWRLPLTSLSVDFPSADDYFMSKVGVSFPHLQSISMMIRTQVSPAGISALAALQELESIDFYLRDGCDRGIRDLINCKKLRKLNVLYSAIYPDTLIALFRNCPNLEHIFLFGIDDVYTSRKAATVLGKFSSLSNRNIKIEFDTVDDVLDGQLRSIWKSKPVENAIKKLDEKWGVKISIKIGLF